MVESDLIVIWGGNPVNTQVNVMTLVAQAKRRGAAKLVVIDPYRTGTAEQADMHWRCARNRCRLGLCGYACRLSG